MKTKHLKYTIKGEHSADDAHNALGEAASQGVITRVDTGGGYTHVYIAASDAGDAKAKLASGIEVKEISESEVTKLG